jgi:gluconokinase
MARQQGDGVKLPLLVIMGVSGSGKSTVGALLADRLGCMFVDADDVHPPANLTKMKAGIALDDADRAPWLDALAGRLDAWRTQGLGGVMACSALKRRYREVLAGDGVRFIYLEEPPETVRARMAARQDHFMPQSLIDSQFRALEPPGGDELVITIAAAATPQERCSQIQRALTQLA